MFFVTMLLNFFIRNAGILCVIFCLTYFSTIFYKKTTINNFTPKKKAFIFFCIFFIFSLILYFQSNATKFR